MQPGARCGTVVGGALFPSCGGGGWPRGEVRVSDSPFLNSDWCGLSWSPWVRFDAPRESWDTLPRSPGVYRVRVCAQPTLAYIGQTGRTLRERLRALVRNTGADQMPWNDPHTAAPALWSFHDAKGLEFAWSGAPVGLAQERLALECYLLWRYRLDKGVSTLCNHGRLHPGYEKSRNRSTGVRGGRLPTGESNADVAQSYPSLRPHGHAADPDWMGLPWSEMRPLLPARVRTIPPVAGVYKLIDMTTGDLLYVGQSASLRERIGAHGKRAWGRRRVGFSFCELPAATAECQRRDVEDDLIGAFYEQEKRSPLFQFGRHSAQEG